MLYTKCATQASKGGGDTITSETLSVVLPFEKWKGQSVLVRIGELL